MPRAGLDASVITTSAAGLVDESGVDALTLQAVAKRFGVASPSLYKHVDGLDHLTSLVGVQTARELGAALRRAATGRAGRDALGAVADAYRAYAKAHPGRYALSQRAARAEDLEHVAATDEMLSVLIGVLRGYGIVPSSNDVGATVLGADERRTIDAARFLRSSLHGFVSLELAQGFAFAQEIDTSFERLVDAVDRALGSW